MKKLLQQMKKLKSKLVEWVYSSIMPNVDRVMAYRCIRKLQKKESDPNRQIKVGFVVHQKTPKEKNRPKPPEQGRLCGPDAADLEQGGPAL